MISSTQSLGNFTKIGLSKYCQYNHLSFEIDNTFLYSCVISIIAVFTYISFLSPVPYECFVQFLLLSSKNCMIDFINTNHPPFTLYKTITVLWSILQFASNAFIQFNHHRIILLFIKSYQLLFCQVLSVSSVHATLSCLYTKWCCKKWVFSIKHSNFLQ